MKRVALISLILGTALALVPVASSMVLDGGSGGGGGLAVVAPGRCRSGDAGGPASQPGTGQLHYGAKRRETIHSDVLGGDGGASVAPASGSGDSSNWSPVLAATLTGMLLLAAAATVTTRRKHPPQLLTGKDNGGDDERAARPARRLSVLAADSKCEDRRVAPFRIGLMQLTMEPVGEMLATARLLDETGFDTIFLAEAYPWWRKHQMEARSSTVVSALMAEQTSRLTIAWGIISPFTRHPVQVAMDARVVQELAPGRFILGFGTSKIFLNNALMQTNKTLGPMRDAVAIVRGVLGGEAFRYEGDTWSADVPAMDADAPREVPPVYVAATAPKMQALAGEIGDGCLTPSITTPAFVRYTRENVKADIDIGCTIVASIADDRDEGRDGAREIAAMYLANKVQNIKGAADTLLDLADIDVEEIRPVAEAMERGGRLAAKEQVTDSILDRCKPIAGTPADCITAIEEYRDAGCTHVMLELWGAKRHEQIRLFAEQVLPQFRS